MYRNFFSYGFEVGQIINIVIRPSFTRIIRVILFTGKILELDVIVEGRISELKKVIQDHTDIDIKYQAVLKNGHQLLDDELISDCLAESNGPVNVNFALNGSLMLDPSAFAPKLGSDCISLGDEFCGGKRIVFIVKDIVVDFLRCCRYLC
jgi:hypothetical protein